MWVVFYVVCTLIVGLHLRHGISSGFQSIGFDHPIYTRRLLTWGIVGAVDHRRGARSDSPVVYLTH